MFIALFLLLVVRWGYLEYRMFWLRWAKRRITQVAHSAGSSARTLSPAENREMLENVAGML